MLEIATNSTFIPHVYFYDIKMTLCVSGDVYNVVYLHRQFLFRRWNQCYSK